MRLIIGLGNYPKKYLSTKHNAGFLIIDEYCKKHKINLDEENFQGLFHKEKDFIIAKPLTLMNLSGKFVRDIIHFYKINIEDILIICDDVNYGIGSFKIRKNGSSGGQNGMGNIIELLGTNEIKRLKIGIGRNNQMILSDYVLSKFSTQELETIKLLSFNATNEIIHEFINGANFEELMNK
jgi:PTH1 family peptidyl-tRNA hydrolase